MIVWGILSAIAVGALLYPVMFSGKDDFKECVSAFFELNFIYSLDIEWDSMKIVVWLGASIVVGIGVYHL